MTRNFFRLLAALLTGAIIAAGLSACTITPAKKVAHGASMSVSSDREAELVAPGGVSVDLPAHSVTGSGTLAVRPASADGLTGWTIQLTGGAKLTGHATLSFIHTLDKGELAPVVQYSEDGGKTLLAASGATLTKTGVSISTSHFSTWFVTWWSDAVAKAKQLWLSMFSPAADGTAPSCPGTAAAKAAGFKTSVTSTDSRVLWCLGQTSDKHALLQLVNARNYPVTVVATSGMDVVQEDASWETRLQKLAAETGWTPPKKGDTLHLAMGGAGLSFEDTTTAQQGVEVEPSGAAYLADAFEYGVKTVVMLLGLFGKSAAEQGVASGFDAVGCLSGGTKMGTANITNANAAASYLRHAVSTVFDCLGEVIKEQLGNDGPVIAAIASGISWFGDGVELLVAAGQAIPDLLKGPYDIVVSAPTAAPSCQPGYLLIGLERSSDGFAIMCDAVDDPGTNIGFITVYDDYTIRIVEPSVGDVTFPKGWVTGSGYPCAQTAAGDAGPTACMSNIGTHDFYILGANDDSYVGEWPIVSNKVGTESRPW